MAQKITVSLIDDLDGTNDGTVAPVESSLDGVIYEADLSEANAERLRDVCAKYIRVARRTHGGKIPSKSAPGQAGLIREWALKNGQKLSDRGRLPTNVVEAYRKDHT